MWNYLIYNFASTHFITYYFNNINIYFQVRYFVTYGQTICINAFHDILFYDEISLFCDRQADSFIYFRDFHQFLILNYHVGVFCDFRIFSISIVIFEFFAIFVDFSMLTTMLAFFVIFVNFLILTVVLVFLSCFIEFYI